MFSRSIIRLTLALIIVVASLLLVTSFTVTAAAPIADARPSTDLIVNPGESIQAAIDAANDGDTIIINAGDYTESLTLSKPVSLTGVNSDTTIIHAVAGQRVLTVTGAMITNSVVISGLTFTGGSADYGGGVYSDFTVSNFTVTLINLRFISNTATIFGGGFACENLMCSLTISNSVFFSNTADGGGGAYAYAGPVTVVGSRFEGNFGYSGGGGLLQFQGGGSVAITDTQFISNSTYGEGGGLLAVDSPIDLNNVDFISNMAGVGGGVFSTNRLAVLNSQFSDNRSTANYRGGGAVAVMGINYGVPVKLVISNTTFIANVAAAPDSRGGAVYFSGPNWSTGASAVYVANTLFVHNMAQTYGAGLFLERSDDATIAYVTVVDSVPNPTPAITLLYRNVSAIIGNCIITNHAIGIQSFEGYVTEGYDLFYRNITNTVGVLTSAHSLVGDPHFVDPAHDDYHLTFGSAAIDHGVDAGIYTDLDGNVRPYGAGFDIGAYEFSGGTRYVATTGDDASNLCLDQLSPCSTVQHAIDVANDGEQVLIASGLYTQSATLSKPVSLTGVNSDTTIIHAVTGQRVLTVTGATINTSVVISGLTFTGGDVRGGYECPAYCGSGLMITNTARPLLQNITVFNNQSNRGGSLFVEVGSPLILTNVTVISNSGRGLLAMDRIAMYNTNIISNEHDGGFIPSGIISGGRIQGNYGGLGGLAVWDALTVTQVQFIDNSSEEDGGGLNIVNGPVSITRSIFEDNYASCNGGGVYAPWAEVYVENSDFVGNIADNTHCVNMPPFDQHGGGGLLANQATIIGGRFESNIARSDGGGLHARESRLTNTDFISNTSGGSGGGLYANDAVTLTNVDLISNTALQTGGGAYISGTATLIDTDFISNTSFEGGGGLEATTADITRGVFERNTTSGHDFGYGAYGRGGGVDVITLTLTDTQFISNTAIYGGGAAADISHLNGGRFERNVALAGNGGGLLNGGYLSGTVFISNSAAGWGGGLSSAWPNSDARLLGVLFEGNHASIGGGGLASLDYSLHVTGTRFIRNSANGYGGGLAFGEGQAHLVNSLFVGNTTTRDGAAVALPEVGQMEIVNATIDDPLGNPRAAVLNIGSTLRLTNTIIANHAVGLQGSDSVSSTMGETTEDYSLFYGNTTNTLGVLNGGHSLIGDPHFVDPAHNDYHLAFGSAAIDHGVDAGVYTDLDGNVRPQGAGFDIGAYEYHGPIYRAFLPVLRR